MSPELDKALCERYPRIFKDRSGDPRATLMCFGFDCGDGWYNIIDTLCNNINAHVSHIRHQHEDMSDDQFEEIHGIVAVQVKEKWGGLRFYTNGSNDYVRGLIDMAEGLSFRTCETCGNPGNPRKGGWVRTLCDACSKDRD